VRHQEPCKEAQRESARNQSYLSMSLCRETDHSPWCVDWYRVDGHKEEMEERMRGGTEQLTRSPIDES
jgi:hypothetical protein